MKKLPHLAFCSWLAFVGAASLSAQTIYDGSPYTGWNSDYTGNEPHTIGLWKFDDPDPSLDAYDGAANPNSYATAAINVADVTTGVSGKFGEGFSVQSGVDGSRAYVSQTDIFNASALSVEVWYQTPAVIDTSGWLFHGLGKTTNKGGVGLQVTPTQLVLNVGNGSGISTFGVAAPDWSANTWYHLAVTFENVGGDGVVSIFLNGNRLGGTTLEDFGNLALSDRSFSVGNRNVSTWSPLLGTYDNFRIADVAYHYAAVPEPATAASLLLLTPVFCLLRRRLFKGRDGA